MYKANPINMYPVVLIVICERVFFSDYFHLQIVSYCLMVGIKSQIESETFGSKFSVEVRPFYIYSLSLGSVLLDQAWLI